MYLTPQDYVYAQFVKNVGCSQRPLHVALTVARQLLLRIHEQLRQKLPWFDYTWEQD